MDYDDAEGVLDEVVAEMRQLPYAELLARVTMPWPYDPARRVREPTDESDRHALDAMRKRVEESGGEPGELQVIFDVGEPTLTRRTGSSGALYRVFVNVTWASPDGDLEVDVSVDEGPGANEDVSESFNVASDDTETSLG
jgi:hypothetical protein